MTCLKRAADRFSAIIRSSLNVPASSTRTNKHDDQGTHKQKQFSPDRQDRLTRLSTCTDSCIGRDTAAELSGHKGLPNEQAVAQQAGMPSALRPALSVFPRGPNAAVGPPDGWQELH
ncbi:MAG: hypothetical protein FRX49_07664 [Trebouxia sp. A1-2]|nr:MAG: hypothetical protein FRX49_07664 [Trebouxia sp. A1-2]